METKPVRKILLYGKSILIDKLASRLQQMDGVEVLLVERDEMPELSDRDLVVIDLRDMKPADALFIAYASPGTLVVGVDALTDRFILMSSKPGPAYATQEAVELLRQAL